MHLIVEFREAYGKDVHREKTSVHRKIRVCHRGINETLNS